MFSSSDDPDIANFVGLKYSISPDCAEKEVLSSLPFIEILFPDSEKSNTDAGNSKEFRKEHACMVGEKCNSLTTQFLTLCCAAI